MSNGHTATQRLDPSGWSVRWEDARAHALVESGDWRNLTMADLARQRVRDDPDRILIVEGEGKLRASEIWQRAQRLASSLLARGLRPGDRISYQLPNWSEAVVIDLAATLAGLVSNPLVPIYRQAELGFMLDDCGSRLIFIPAQFRGFDYRAMMRGLLPKLAAKIDVIVLRGDPEEFEGYEDLLESACEFSPMPTVDPNAVKLVLYTSGTTGRPKGVLHTHNTVDVQGRQFGRIGTFTAADRVLVASPVSHITGAILAFH
ncbi:MAG: hypothetical protein EOP18_11515 [Rhizobiaceae bacterium]|nr:MAG: hypothetical protein EOP18_11515 [Rhizobiaceae bacterium]